MSPRAGCLRRGMPITFVPCPLVLHAPGCACGLEANKSTATGGCYRTRGKGGEARGRQSSGLCPAMSSRPREVQRCDNGMRIVELLSGRIGVGWWFPSVAGFLHVHVQFGCRSVERLRCDQAQVWHPSPAPPPLHIKAPLFQTRVRQVQNCPPTIQNVLNKSASLFITDELGQLCPKISE